MRVLLKVSLVMALLLLLVAGTVYYSCFRYTPSKWIQDHDLTGADFEAKDILNQREHASRLLSNVKKVCDENGLSFLGATKFVPVQGTGGGSSKIIFLSSPDSSFTFGLPYNGGVTWKNVAMMNYLRKNSEAGTKTAPAWSSEKALQIGEAFVRALIDGKDVRLGAAQAYRISESFDDVPHTCWHVMFTRIDSHGYKFRGDEFDLTFPEGYAPYRAEVPGVYPHVERKEPFMSREKALAIAEKANKKEKVGDFLLTNTGLEPEVSGNSLVWIFRFGRSGGGSADIFVDAYSGEYSTLVYG